MNFTPIKAYKGQNKMFMWSATRFCSATKQQSQKINESDFQNYNKPKKWRLLVLEEQYEHN